MMIINKRKNESQIDMQMHHVMEMLRKEKALHKGNHDEAKRIVFDYLSHDKSGLLPTNTNTELEGACLDRLLKSANNSGASLIRHLVLLETEENHFHDIEEMVIAI